MQGQPEHVPHLQDLLVLCSKELHKMTFFAPGFFQVLGGAYYLECR